MEPESEPEPAGGDGGGSYGCVVLGVLGVSVVVYTVVLIAMRSAGA